MVRAGLQPLLARGAWIEINDSMPVVADAVWAHSSAGRAPALQAGGHRFKSYCAHQKWPGSSVG